MRPKREPRPIGRKRAKEEGEKFKQKNKKLQLVAESVAVQRDLKNALKRHFETMMLTSAPVGCDESDAVEYFNTMLDRALRYLREEFSQSHEKDQASGQTVETPTDEVDMGATIIL